MVTRPYSDGSASTGRLSAISSWALWKQATPCPNRLKASVEQAPRLRAGVNGRAEGEQAVRVDPPAETGLTALVGYERLDELAAGQACRRVKCHVQLGRLNCRVNPDHSQGLLAAAESPLDRCDSGYFGVRV
jgi:hypothetical protein